MVTTLALWLRALPAAFLLAASSRPEAAQLEGSAPAGHAAQRGDTVVRTIGHPVHSGIATLVEEASIGAASGPPEHTFSAIAEVAVGADGSVFVLDRPGGGTPFLRQYDATGRFVRTIGRAGEGPGEYRSPSGLAVLRDGRILVRGAANHRINVYSPSGEPLDGWRLNETGTSIGPNMIVVDTGGTIWVRANPGFLPDGARGPSRLMRLTATGALIDTVAAPEMSRPGPPQLAAERGGARMSMNVPYTAEASSALSPLGYFVTGVTERYAIDLRIPPRRAGAAVWREGDTVISLRRERVPSVAVSDAERAARREYIETSLRRTDPGWRWSGVDIPRVKPAYTSFRVAQDGRIWVLTSQASERFDPAVDQPGGAPMSVGGGRGGGRAIGSGGGPPPAVPPVPWRSPAVYDVLEPDGRWLGQVRVPYGVTLHVMRGDHVWASTSDDDGVPYVKRYRIAWR